MLGRKDHNVASSGGRSKISHCSKRYASTARTAASSAGVPRSLPPVNSCSLRNIVPEFILCTYFNYFIHIAIMYSYLKKCIKYLPFKNN